MTEEKKKPKYSKNKDKLNNNLSKETKEKSKNRDNKIVEKVESTEKFLITSFAIIFSLIIIISGIFLFTQNTKNIEVPEYALLIGNQEISIQELKEVVNRNPTLGSDTLISSYINDTILLQKAMDSGYNTSDEEVDSYIEALVAQSGGTLEDLKATLTSINNSFDSFKVYVKNAIIISKFIDAEIKPFVDVSDEEALEFYEENPYMFEQPEKFNVSHILVSDLELANTILEEAKDTTDFQLIVDKYANDSIEAVNFEFFRGSVVEPFQDAVDSVEENTLYDGVVESNYTAFSGYHIVYVYEKTPASAIDYEDIKENLIEYIQTEKSDETLKYYSAQLISDAKIWFNYKLLDKENIDYTNLEKLYELSNKKFCINEESDIVYFSNNKEFDDSITFYDVSNPGIVEVFKDCFGDKITDISKVKLPVMICLKNDVIIEGGNLKDISSVCN